MGNTISGFSSFKTTKQVKTSEFEGGTYSEVAKNALLSLMNPPPPTPPLATVLEEVRRHHDGKAINLVVGITAAGKSTLVTYLQGHDIKFDDEGKAIGPKDPQLKANYDYPNIGESKVFSETYRPMAFTNPDGFLVYSDCPGFFDTDVGPKQVMSSLGLELAVKNASKIRSLMIVVNYESLDLSKGTDFAELSDYLSDLFNQQIHKYADSIFFVFNRAYTVHPINGIITKTPAQIVDDITFRIQEIKDKLDHASLPLSGVKKENIAKLEKINEIFKFMVEECHPRKNLLCVNITNENSRNELEKKLLNQKMPPIPKNAFNFNVYEGSKQTIANYATEVAQCALADLKKSEMQRDNQSMLSREVIEKNQALSSLDDQIKEKKNKLKECNSGVLSEKERLNTARKEFETDIKLKNEELQKLERSKEDKERALAHKELQIKQSKAERDSLDTDVEEVTWSAKTEQRYSVGDGYHVKKYETNVIYTRYEATELGGPRGKPDIKDPSKYKYGKFSVLSDEKATDKYKFNATYESDRFYGAFHKVELFVTKKLKFARQINSLKSVMDTLELDLVDLRFDINALTKQITYKTSEINTLKSEKEKLNATNAVITQEDHKIKLENDIADLESNKHKLSIEILELDNKKSQPGLVKPIDMSQYIEMYYPIKELSYAMTFPPIVLTFIEQFSELVTERRKEKSSEKQNGYYGSFHKPAPQPEPTSPKRKDDEKESYAAGFRGF